MQKQRALQISLDLFSLAIDVFAKWAGPCFKSSGNLHPCLKIYAFNALPLTVTSR
jgi:hypothetical protein